MTHLTFDEISEAADGRRPTADGERHLQECAECQATLRRLRELVDAVQKLPHDIAPPPEVWTALRARVGTRQAPPRSRQRWLYGGWIAAAAVLVIAIGLNILPPRANKLKGAKIAATRPSDPVLVLAVEKNYVATVDELRLALDSQRATLSPATIRVLEHSLAAIDTAIAEAREALAKDPANQILVGILSANYERKVELLKRATELSSSS